jgi:hypothetical protein
MKHLCNGIGGYSKKYTAFFLSKIIGRSVLSFPSLPEFLANRKFEC